MKGFIKIILLLIVIIGLVNCAPIPQQRLRFGVQDLAIDVTHTGIIQRPMLVDLNVVNTAVSGRASETIPADTPHTTISAIRSHLERLAVKNAVETANADLLVRPIYTVTHQGNTLTVEVKGYPARYTNFRPITRDDPEWNLVFDDEEASKTRKRR